MQPEANWVGHLLDHHFKTFCGQSRMKLIFRINLENSHNDYNLSIVDVTQDKGLLAIQGPKSTAFLQNLTSIKLNNIPYYSFAISQYK